MIKLDDDMLKAVVGGNVEVAGMSLSAADIINMWNTQKSFCKMIFAQYGSSNPQVIEDIKNELLGSGLSIPSDLKGILGI